MGCNPNHSGAGGDNECQDIRGWQNVSLTDLLSRSAPFAQSECYVYTVKTTRRLSDGSVCQSGSGPNLEGSLATLCTCMHHMRLGRTERDWPNTWVVGLTSTDKSSGFGECHYLFYVMRVQRVFRTHKELFEFLAKEYPSALAVKLAHKNRRGDVFRPRTGITDGSWSSPTMYLPPVPNHTHCKVEGSTKWHRDVSSQGDEGKRTSIPLLVGDPQMTFVWNRPTIRYRGERGVRRKKFGTLAELLGCLECLRDENM